MAMREVRQYFLKISAMTLPVLLAASFACQAFPTKYDAEIRAAAKLYMPQADPLMWKAQLWQESRLDPNAVSPVGARGLAQIMPGTFAEISRGMGAGIVSPFDASWSIRMGAWYMRKRINDWSAPRPYTDRHNLAMASYNAGLGNILRAQKACGGPNLYDEIIVCLPQITGRHSKETIDYVRLTNKWYLMMVVS